MGIDWSLALDNSLECCSSVVPAVDASHADTADTGVKPAAIEVRPVARSSHRDALAVVLDAAVRPVVTEPRPVVRSCYTTVAAVAVVGNAADRAYRRSHLRHRRGRCLILLLRSALVETSHGLMLRWQLVLLVVVVGVSI